MPMKSEIHMILSLTCFSFLSMNVQIRRCANPNPSYTVSENTSFKKAVGTIINVPVIFHVIYDNSGNGNVQETILQAQVDTLNAVYSRFGSQYRFYLSAITRTNNTNWWDINFYSRPDAPAYDIPSQTEIDMTNALAIDPTHAFNIYISRLTNDFWVGLSISHGRLQKIHTKMGLSLIIAHCREDLIIPTTMGMYLFMKEDTISDFTILSKIIVHHLVMK